MSDTPITDAAEIPYLDTWKLPNITPEEGVVHVSIARQLEREVARLSKQLREAALKPE